MTSHLDLTFTGEYPHNASISAGESSSCIYTLRTQIQGRYRTDVVLRAGDREVARIGIQTSLDGKSAKMSMSVRGRDCVPKKSFVSRRKWPSFKASNAVRYEWRYEGGETWKMYDLTSSAMCVAHYRRSFMQNGPPPSLRITMQKHITSDIVEEIIATFIYVDQKRKKDANMDKMRTARKRIIAQTVVEQDQDEEERGWTRERVEAFGEAFEVAAGIQF